MRRQQEDLAEILEGIDIEHYLEREGIDFKASHGRRGRQLIIKECPVCGSDSHKVYLNADTGLGNCFAGDHPAGENFNKFKFIQAQEQLRGGELVRLLKQLAKECGFIPKERKVLSVEAEFKMIESIELPYLGQSLQYLYDRGIDNDAAAHYGLRYCQKAWWTYTVGDQEQFQLWNERVVIPVADMDGVVRTFQGRDITGEQKPKYLFAKGLPSTGQYLYGAHEAIGASTVVAAEGVFDKISVDLAINGQQGWADVAAVGTFGVSLSEIPGGQLDQLMALRDAGMKHFIILWDNEKSAIEKALDLGLRLRRMGIDTSWAVIHGGKDANEVDADTVRRSIMAAERVTPESAMLKRLSM